ncbi:hypothetical protein ACFRAQ_34730 [Nocardia sp. NPDC056611]|uniref:hypothetical protein n=1 Tax=Nocardia sp. NPDC056611 TaxID=3345877 RepID=UPI00366CE195
MITPIDPAAVESELLALYGAWYTVIDALAGKFGPGVRTENYLVRRIDDNRAIPTAHRSITWIVLDVFRRSDFEMAYLRKTGEYNSFDGQTWDGPITEVQPKQVEQTTWVTVDA